MRGLGRSRVYDINGGSWERQIWMVYNSMRVLGCIAGVFWDVDTQWCCRNMQVKCCIYVEFLLRGIMREFRYILPSNQPQICLERTRNRSISDYDFCLVEFRIKSVSIII